MVSEKMLRAYIECALWSSLDDNGTPLDTIEDISLSQEARETMEKDLEDFVALLDGEGVVWNELVTEESLGHDFWLTRNGHGTGFWDRGLDELGEQLTYWSKIFRECDLYVGDDDLIYIY